MGQQDGVAGRTVRVRRTMGDQGLPPPTLLAIDAEPGPTSGRQNRCRLRRHHLHRHGGLVLRVLVSPFPRLLADAYR